MACAAFGQAEKSIIIDASKFRPVQTDALTGVNIDPIGVDYSKRPCARLKIKINRMTVEEINGIEVKVATNNAVMKCQTAQYDTGLIVEMTAKPDTRFYFHHNEFGDSNEVCLNLEPNKEYYLEAYLNQQYPITVAANVAGADVYLDGVYKGQTDANYVLTVKDVIPGEHTLRVELGGIKQEQKIVVSASSVFFRQTINTQATKPQFVVFSVEPQSAVVSIDGKHHPAQDGFVQLVLQNGNYNYSVSAVGYHTQSGNFTVAGAKVEKEVKLMADAANVTITAPDGAEIWVNGSKKGTSSWSGTLSSGTYIFEARKSGHQSASISANISSSQPNSHFTLPAPTPIVGSLVVMSAPAMAEVAIDGKVVGRTPLDLGDVLVGEHTVTISKEGYAPKTQKVTLVEGKVETVNITLSQAAPLNGVTAIEIDSSLSAAQLYEKGKELYKANNFNAAMQYYHAAAEQGLAEAQCRLGIEYNLGLNIGTDYTEAFKWFRKAAEQGHVLAQDNLATMYYYGRGVTKNFTEAVKWFRKAAESGNCNAQVYMGDCYHYGRGVSQNYLVAAMWYRRAADQGSTIAQRTLGSYYLNGMGVSLDYEQGFNWCKKAADSGNHIACGDVGWCYENGKGVAKSRQMAIEYYRKGASDSYCLQALKRLGVRP